MNKNLSREPKPHHPTIPPPPKKKSNQATCNPPSPSMDIAPLHPSRRKSNFTPGKVTPPLAPLPTTSRLSVPQPPSSGPHYLPATSRSPPLRPCPRSRPLPVTSSPRVPPSPRPLRSPPVPTSPRPLRTRRAPPRCRRHHWPGGKSFPLLILRPRECGETSLIL